MTKEQYIEKYNDTKEQFCPPCALAPLALAGAGVAGFGANQKGKHKKMKNIMLCGGITITIISIIALIIYLNRCKECSS